MASTAMPLLGCRLLIVEDNFIVSAAIADAVEAAGAQVVGPFPTMIDALERLSDLEAIDGAILDVGLEEGEQSYPLAEALLTTQIPMMFLTGVAQSDLPERFARTPHMSKPFTEEGLVAYLVEIGVRRRS